jgi:preprotein translocase subunit SecA
MLGWLARGIERSVTALVGTSNARSLRRLQPALDSINALESKYCELSDGELKEQTHTFRRRLKSGETLDDLLIEAFAVCREAADRVLGMRHFDVQVLGGLVLHGGSIAEMATGEGKTLVATLPAYLNALEGEGVHVVTVNDYLARRDMEWMGKLAQMLAGVGSFYIRANMHWPHLIDTALKAHHLYKRDVHYVVDDGKVVIVDEFTGRLLPGRQWRDGLHRAVEAKEALPIRRDSQTLADITRQNYFRLYDKICGMTGTAMTEASELWNIYRLKVIAVPTNRPLRRFNHPDVIYLTEAEKHKAVVDEMERMHQWDVLVLADGGEQPGRITSKHDEEIEFEPADGPLAERRAFALLRTD